MEPFGGQIEDYRAGLAPAMLVRVNSTGDSDPIGPLEFFPHWQQEAAPEMPLEPEPFEPSSASQEDVAQRIFSLSTPG